MNISNQKTFRDYPWVFLGKGEFLDTGHIVKETIFMTRLSQVRKVRRFILIVSLLHYKESESLTSISFYVPTLWNLWSHSATLHFQVIILLLSKTTTKENQWTLGLSRVLKIWWWKKKKKHNHMKSRFDRLGLIQMKSFCSMNDCSNGRLAAHWKKIFTSHFCATGPSSRR